MFVKNYSFLALKRLTPSSNIAKKDNFGEGSN
jgi:hypothetical protein